MCVAGSSQTTVSIHKLMLFLHSGLCRVTAFHCISLLHAQCMTLFVRASFTALLIVAVHPSFLHPNQSARCEQPSARQATNVGPALR